MSRDKKRQVNWYQPDDGEAIARHLEKMAAKGWLLEDVDNLFFRYRRGEPARVKYALTFFPDASIYDPCLTEGQRTYIDYCRAAGWELAAFYGPVQYFRSVLPDPMPIETDEAVKLAAIRRTMRKTFVLSYVLLLCVFLLYLPLCWMQLRRSPMEFFSRNHTLALAIATAGGLLFCGGMLLDYLVWVLRSRRSTARGGPCARPHTRFRRWFGAAAIGVMAAALLLMAADASMLGQRGYILFFLAVYGGVLLLARRRLRLMKRKGFQRGTARGLFILFAVAAGVAVGFLAPAAYAGLAEAGVIRTARHPLETLTYGVHLDYTRDLYRDSLPVTLEDLGYTVTEEDYCSYRAERYGTFLAVRNEYTQDTLNFGSDLPVLWYQTFDTSWSWLLERCWEELTGDPERYDPWSLRRLEPAPWGAEEAWAREGLTHYFLRYPDRIVTFSLGDEASPEQLDAVFQALRG